jgi:RNA polymerase sigma factor (sigma-70 family)
MPTESPRPLARQLLRVVLGTSEVPDRDLLARFVASRDEDAFAEIVRRHGPMVLAVCRRVTGRPHDAEDAFQAAFLVLARRAAHVGRPELLANWLYGVAFRTALEARAARRRAEERVVPAATEPAAPVPPDDPAELRRVIDEELAKLPDKYRTAVVLCELEGLPRATAAAQMGIPEGTLSSRLAHARKVLAERLARRGVTAGATAIAVALGRDATATVVPRTLMNATVLAAARFAPAGAAPLGVSPAVSSLTDGVLKTMLATRLRQLFAIGLLACGLIGVGGALAQQLGGPPTPADPAGLPPLSGVDVEVVIQKKQKAKDEEPQKKVGAKGIEDDDVPYGSFPAQAVVRLEDGKLIVRQRVQHFVSFQQLVGGHVVAKSQKRSAVSASEYDPADVAVFDMKGNRLSPKAWKELLKSDVHALIAHDGKLPNPRELTLFKQDTLLVVLPGGPSGYTMETRDGRTYYVPTPPATVAPSVVVPPTLTAPAVPPAPAVPAPPYPNQPAKPNKPAKPALPPQPVPEGGDLLPPPAVPAGLADTVRGFVRDVEGSRVVLSVGRDAGLNVGSALDVYREVTGKHLGTALVKSVEAKRAVAEFRAARGVALDKLRAEEQPRKGDSVGRVRPLVPVPAP